MRRTWLSRLFVLGVVVFAPSNRAWAQSAIAGVVRDTSGAVLPGVAVEAASPALIEKARSAVTDVQGQFKIVDLRPGTYSVTFVLPGFSTVKREGIELTANFTASVNVEMKIGGVEETITVSGASPIVDVQTTERRDVLTRDVLDALPTGRNYQTIGAVLPGVTMGRFDVGGSTAMQQSTVMTRCGSERSAVLRSDPGLHSIRDHYQGERVLSAAARPTRERRFSERGRVRADGPDEYPAREPR